MFYVLVYKPDIDTSKIDTLRKKYDPYYNLIETHVTLIFPLPDLIGEDTLIEHIRPILKQWKPFEIHLKGLEKSWDHWLNLIVQEGNNEIIKLHDQLYTGILTRYLRNDLVYIPHIGLGLFTENKDSYNVVDPKLLSLDKGRYETALKEATDLNLDYKATLDNLTLVKLDDKLSKVFWSKEFRLGEV